MEKHDRSREESSLMERSCLAVDKRKSVPLGVTEHGLEF